MRLYFIRLSILAAVTPADSYFGAGATPASIRLKMPRNGIATHFGRLLSSYRSSYKALRIRKLRSKSRKSS